MNGFLPRSEMINCRNGAARSNPPRERREPTTFISSTVLLQMILAICGNLLLMRSNGKDPYSVVSRTRSRADVSGGKSEHFCGERGIRTPKSLRTPVFKTGAIAVLPALLLLPSRTQYIRYRGQQIPSPHSTEFRAHLAAQLQPPSRYCC